MLPHLPLLDGTDSHLYFGWYHGNERDLPGFAASMPRMVRFVSEFGAQAVPAAADFMEPKRWPDLDWDLLQERHGLQLHAFEKFVPPADYATFDEWREATQKYQANAAAPSHRDTAPAEVPADRRVLLLHVQRRLPDGVVECARSRATSEVGISGRRRCLSTGDRRRRPTAGDGDGRRGLGARCARGQRCASTAGRHRVHGATQLARRVTRLALGRRRSPRFCVRVGTIQFVVADRPGELWLDLVVEHGDEVATNRYVSTIVR